MLRKFLHEDQTSQFIRYIWVAARRVNSQYLAFSDPSTFMRFLYPPKIENDRKGRALFTLCKIVYFDSHESYQ